MIDPEIALFVQSLRGSQAVIALAFLLVRAPMLVEDLEQVTGLDNDTVRKALKAMKGKGLLFPQVGEHGRQTWVPRGGTFFGLVDGQNPKTSDSGSVVIVVESEGDKSLVSTTLTNRRQSPKTSDSGGDPEHWQHMIKPAHEIRQCLAILNSAGIVGKKAQALAEDHKVTAEMIVGHLAWVQAEHWDNPLGMVIYRLENHLEPPILKGNGHAESCNCVECRGLKVAKRYTEGEFSVFFKQSNDDDESEEQ